MSVFETLNQSLLSSRWRWSSCYRIASQQCSKKENSSCYHNPSSVQNLFFSFLLEIYYYQEPQIFKASILLTDPLHKHTALQLLVKLLLYISDSPRHPPRPPVFLLISLWKYISVWSPNNSLLHLHVNTEEEGGILSRFFCVCRLKLVKLLIDIVR